MKHQPAMNTAPSLSTHLQPQLDGGVELCAGRTNLGRFPNVRLAEGTQRFLNGHAKASELRAPDFATQLKINN